MSNDTKHLGLGAITAKVGLTKSNLVEKLQLGLGVAVFPVAYGLARGAILRAVPQLAQNTWAERAVRALSGVVLGTITERIVKGTIGGRIGDGMAASAVGSVLMDSLTPFLSPAAGAAQSAVTAAEMSTGEAQVSGFNPMGRGLAGLGQLGRVAENPGLLFGVGTPDMSAASMFNGATVAVEEAGPMAGATVAIEQPNFAGILG